MLLYPFGDTRKNKFSFEKIATGGAVKPSTVAFLYLLHIFTPAA